MPNGRFLKKSEKSNFSLTKNSYFLNFCKLYKIGTMCASLEHEKVGKATFNDSTVKISRLGKFRSTRYSAYSSDMRISNLKSAKLNDFCHFLRKKLDFEVFFAQVSWFILWKLKNCPKGSERVAFKCLYHCHITLWGSTGEKLIFRIFSKSIIWAYYPY